MSSMAAVVMVPSNAVFAWFCQSNESDDMWKRSLKDWKTCMEDQLCSPPSAIKDPTPMSYGEELRA